MVLLETNIKFYMLTVRKLVSFSFTKIKIDKNQETLKLVI